MEPNAILNADPLDLLFDNRNKSYGAYPLRKFYDRRLLTSLGFSLAAGVIFFWLLTLGPKPLLATTIVLEGSDLIPMQPPVMEKKPTPVPPRSFHVIHPPSVVYNVPLIVPDKDAMKPIHTITDLDGKNTGNIDLAGPPQTGIAEAVQPGGAGNAAPETVKEAAPEVYRTADVMPQFPGGMSALTRFLNRNLRMPMQAEPGTKVSVLATFVIGADGRVRQTEISHSGGDRYDAEVERVLAKMPAWIPGRMGTRTVAVYFTLPVQFLVPEE